MLEHSTWMTLYNNKIMTNIKYISVLLLCLPLMASSCKKPDDGGEVVLPTNLATVITVDEGLVDIQATANNANYFSFMFFEGPDSTYVEATDGVASYTFSNSGNPVKWQSRAKPRMRKV